MTDPIAALPTPDIAAITIPTSERLVVAAEFALAGEDFDTWQLTTLAAKLESLRMQRARAEAQSSLAAAAAELRASVPSLFPEAPEPEAVEP